MAGTQKIALNQQAATPTANFDFGGFKITNHADPASPQDVATKAYADSVGALRPTQSSIAPTTTDITAVVNKIYFADISGLTADRNFKLPGGAVGDTIQLKITVTHASYEFIIKGDTGITINGGSAATEWSRLFIAGEQVTFLATSTTNWEVVYDGRIPAVAELRRITSDLTTNTAGANTIPDWNSLNINRGDIGDLTNDLVNCRRAGLYRYDCGYSAAVAITDGKYVVLYMYGGASGATQVARCGIRSSAASVYPNVSVSGLIQCALDDQIIYKYATEEANKGLLSDVTAGNIGSSRFAVSEILPNR